MCVELIDSVRLKGAVISGSIIKGIVVGIIEAKFSNLMEKEDVNFDNVRQVLHHYQTKKPRFICEIGEKTSKIWEKSKKMDWKMVSKSQKM